MPGSGFFVSLWMLRVDIVSPIDVISLMVCVCAVIFRLLFYVIGIVDLEFITGSLSGDF